MGNQAKIKHRSHVAKLNLRNPKHVICVRRSHNNFHAQLKDPAGIVVTGISTLTKEIKALIKGHAGNKDAAYCVGQNMAKVLGKKKIKQVIFDRSGYIYHGVVASFVKGMRDSGIEV